MYFCVFNRASKFYSIQFFLEVTHPENKKVLYFPTLSSYKCMQKESAYCFIFKRFKSFQKYLSCICENKAADQLHGNREADQRLCFR